MSENGREGRDGGRGWKEGRKGERVGKTGREEVLGSIHVDSRGRSSICMQEQQSTGGHAPQFRVREWELYLGTKGHSAPSCPGTRRICAARMHEQHTTHAAEHARTGVAEERGECIRACAGAVS